MQTVLVTGAAGGIGARLRQLLKGVYRELRLSDIKRPSDLGPDETFIAADLASLAEVERAVAGVDGIVHLGGFSVEETAQAVDTLSRFLESSRVTALLVEHDMEVVFRLAHKITVLHRGAVIADGPPEAVKADAGVQQAYLGGID